MKDGDIDFELGTMQSALRDAAGERNLDFVDATGLATTLMGDSIATNPFMLGYAFQKGSSRCRWRRSTARSNSTASPSR